MVLYHLISSPGGSHQVTFNRIRKKAIKLFRYDNGVPHINELLSKYVIEIVISTMDDLPQ